MKRQMILLMGAVALALGLVGTPASWANSLTFQGVTFNLDVVGGNLQLQINNTDSATGNWAGIDFLNAFQLSDIGIGAANASLSTPGFTPTENSGLNSSGCGAGNPTDQFCFAATPSPDELANDNTYTITCTGTCNFDLSSPHLKVLFSGSEGARNGHGDLLSQDISVPEPASLILLGAGLAGIGIWKRKSTKI